MSAIPKHKMTIEEYIEFDKNNEGKWEYFDGEVMDMAGGTLEHNQIASNISRFLGNKLEEKGCRSLPYDMRLKVPKALPYRYPDVVVVCDDPIIETIQGQQMLVNPLLIVEALSTSTKGYDFDTKFTAYLSCGQSETRSGYVIHRKFQSQSSSRRVSARLPRHLFVLRHGRKRTRGQNRRGGRSSDHERLPMHEG